MENQSNVCGLGKSQAFVRAGQMHAHCNFTTCHHVTLHALLFMVILFLPLDLSAAVFWSAFACSPSWAFVSTFFVSVVEVELFSVVSACVITTQFPSPAAVTNDARQRFLSVPPLHLMLSGSLMASCCVPLFVGS